VAQRLREMGFAEAYALRGGLDAWLTAQGPVEPRAG
jgi:rhodanese-related sulfurtransferase